MRPSSGRSRRRSRACVERAVLSLEGLSVGDAFGETFLRNPDLAGDRLSRRRTLPPPWPWTDDSQMAVAVVEVLVEHGQIDQDALARRFAARYEPQRGYGAGAQQLLREVRRGRHWESAARALFGGDGSLGNGAAMRVAPLGAFFAGDLELAAEEAARSAEVTHAHAEGAAGAIAVAVAAALACESHGAPLEPGAFLRSVEERVPAGATRDGIVDASRLAGSVGVSDAARVLGNGSRVTAPDTVPFCLWAAARHADSFADAMWATARGLGDIDTNCAIVGGVLALRLGLGGIPLAWRQAREPLPRVDWFAAPA
ncbi:MAG TPA: ADP-ribosylglycohydrolase family protein [Candidatus Acidoferrum sp.]|nr:ADP-ribosylglycohydrolase family protein [Candidatus Acidoferrum sp.]